MNYSFIKQLREQRGIKVNIYDIAKEAGVSISTVSRVLNNKGNVNEQTRKKVEEVLKRNNYTPSAIARGMVSKSMRTIAVLTVDIRVPHYATTAYIIERECSKKGYEVLLCNTGGEKKETEKYLTIVLEKHVDGIIFVGSIFNTICEDKRIKRLLGKVPMVVANGTLQMENAYSILVNDKGGISLMVRHLVEKGHKHIYYVKDMDTMSARLKCEGFVQCMKECGLEAEANNVIETESSIDGGRMVVKILQKEKKKVTAIICGEDITAAGVVKELLQQGIQVPNDVAVTGYNNSQYARICQPQLTTVDNKPELVATLSVKLLTDLIEKKENSDCYVIEPEIVLGETT